MPKMRSNDVLADHRTGTSGFRFADVRMPEMLRHRNLRGVDFPRNKCLYRASLVGSRAASAFGNNGNTAASIAMTASRGGDWFDDWVVGRQFVPEYLHHPVFANRTFPIRRRIGRFCGDFRLLTC